MELLIGLLVKVGIYSTFLIALNSLMIGKMNLWAIGNIVYFSVGAFSTGFLSNNGLLTIYNSYLLFIIVPIISTVISFVFFFVSRRLKQDFYLFFSLFFIELNLVVNNILAGPSGYSHISRPAGLETNISLLITVGIILAIVSYWITLFNKSKVNYLHAIIQNDEILASSLGINIDKTQLPVFISSAILSGIMGILFAFYSYGADHRTFSSNEIIMLFALLILGGIDSIKGSVTAAFIYVFFIYSLDSILSNDFGTITPNVSQILFGILLIIIPFILPKGLFGNKIFK